MAKEEYFGCWEKPTYVGNTKTYYCSECGFALTLDADDDDLPKECPSCNEQMDGVAEIKRIWIYGE